MELLFLGRNIFDDGNRNLPRLPIWCWAEHIGLNLFGDYYFTLVGSTLLVETVPLTCLLCYYDLRDNNWHFLLLRNVHYVYCNVCKRNLCFKFNESCLIKWITEWISLRRSIQGAIHWFHFHLVPGWLRLVQYW